MSTPFIFMTEGTAHIFNKNAIGTNDRHFLSREIF